MGLWRPQWPAYPAAGNLEIPLWPWLLSGTAFCYLGCAYRRQKLISKHNKLWVCVRVCGCVCASVCACASMCVSIIIRPHLTLCLVLDLVICLAETACKLSGAAFQHVACGMRDAASGKWQTAQAACLPFKLDLCITQINKPKHTQRQRLHSLPTLGHRFASFHISLNKIDEQPQSAAHQQWHSQCQK